MQERLYFRGWWNSSPVGRDPKADGFTGNATELFQIGQDNLANTEMVGKGGLFGKQKDSSIISAAFPFRWFQSFCFILTVLKKDHRIASFFFFSGELQTTNIHVCTDFPFLFPIVSMQIFFFIFFPLLPLLVSFIHFPPFSHTLSIMFSSSVVFAAY